MAQHRRAAHAATDQHFQADLTRIVLHKLKADIVQLDGGTIDRAAGHRDLELARQEREFRVQRRPLAQQLGIGARIGDLVGGRRGELIGADVADAVAAGLEGMHFHAGQIGEQVGHLLQLHPVILDVLARGEMAIAAVITAGDVGQHAHLA